MTPKPSEPVSSTHYTTTQRSLPAEVSHGTLNQSFPPHPPTDGCDAPPKSAQHSAIEMDNALNSPAPLPEGMPAKVKTSTNTLTSNIDQKTAFWEAYNKAGDVEDKEFVASSGGDLDVLLIFAGLFSAINTAFIIEAYKNLKVDPVDETNKLLRSVLFAVQNSSSINTIDAEQFSATPRDIRINICFFLSLCCSLCAAFGAVLAKQWLTQYDRDGGGGLKPLSARGRERQLKYEARGRWGLEHVIATLPTLLQFSLFFFLIGLIDFVWLLDTAITHIVVAFTSFAILFYVTTTFISVINPSSPFQTRFSALLQPLWSFFTTTLPAALRTSIHHLIHNGLRLTDKVTLPPMKLVQPWLMPLHLTAVTMILLAKTAVRLYSAILSLSRRVTSYASLSLKEGAKDPRVPPPSADIDTHCIVYLLERMTRSEDLEILADAMEGMPEGVDADAVVEALFTFHLKPTPGDLWRFPGLNGHNWKPLLRILHVLLARWKLLGTGFDTLVYSTSSLTSHLFVDSLAPELWRVTQEAPGDVEASKLIDGILAILPIRNSHISFATCLALQTWHREAMFSLLQSNGVVLENSLAVLCSATGCLSSSLGGPISSFAWHTSSGILSALSSTMWVDTSQRTLNASNFWMTTMRMQVLSNNPSDDLVALGFAEYLARCFNHYAKPSRALGNSSLQSRDEDNQVWLYWSYLLSIRQLLTRKDAQRWSKELTKYGHLSCLRMILSDYYHDWPFTGAPLALHAFLCIWTHDALEADSSQPSTTFLASDCVQSIVGILDSQSLRISGAAGRISYHSFDHNAQWLYILPEIEQMMKWLFTYLEAAIQSGLLEREGRTKALRGYSKWCEEVGKEMPAAQTKELLNKLERVVHNLVEEDRGDLADKL